MSSLHLLSNQQEHIPTLAKWHQDQWGFISPQKNISSRIAEFCSENGKSLPITFISTNGNDLEGSARLITCDLASRQDLTPWLASVYVRPDLRCKGIATQLIDKVLEQARKLNFKIIFLYTLMHEEFYAARGWHFLETMMYHGQRIVIMEHEV